MLHLENLGSGRTLLHIRLDVAVVLVVMVLIPVLPESAFLEEVRNFALVTDL